jgi:protein-disulfide isomerase
MTEQTDKKILLASGILLGAIGTGIGVYQHSTIEALTRQVEDLKTTVETQKAKPRFTFSSKKQFEREVAASINQFIVQRQQAEIEDKYAEFSAAPETVEDGKHIYGSLNARFTLVEFSDMECPYCKRFHSTPKQIVDASKGRVNWQWKHLPLSFHNPAAQQEALAAECIAEQKGNRGFWVFVNDVFRHTQGNGGGVANLAALVSDVGAELNKFRECLASGKYEEQIQQDIQKATGYGINGTPATFIVDNRTGKSQLLAGAQSAQAVMAIIRKMSLEAKEGASAAG